MFLSPGFAGILGIERRSARSTSDALSRCKQERIGARSAFLWGPAARQPDSLEDALEPIRAAQNAPAVLVETRGSSILAPRVYATGIDLLRPHLEYNGLIFMQHSPKFHPLLWAPCSN